MSILKHVVVVVALATAALAAQSQTAFPAKPVKLIVAFPPGGTTDVIGRLVANKLSEQLGQQVFVDNRAGAGGMIGTDAVAKADPDGYTLLFSSSTLATYTALYSKVTFDPVKDFAPVGFVATTPYVMVVHPSLPAKSVAELVSHAKANPGSVNYAASTPGGGQHLAWELFKRSTATDLFYVPYKGTGALLPDLLAGRLQAGIDNVAVLTQYIKSGALRPLAVTGTARSALLPEVPTMSESGMPNFRVVGWFGVYAPAKTPAPVVKRLNDAMVAVMKQKDLRERITELGGEPESGSQDDLRKLLDVEIAQWGKVIRDAGIKVE
jgi:tripartite-type tricarboxylate transporter receptor subunit TctC